MEDLQGEVSDLIREIEAMRTGNLNPIQTVVGIQMGFSRLSSKQPDSIKAVAFVGETAPVLVKSRYLLGATQEQVMAVVDSALLALRSARYDPDEGKAYQALCRYQEDLVSMGGPDRTDGSVGDFVNTLRKTALAYREFQPEEVEEELKSWKRGWETKKHLLSDTEMVLAYASLRLALYPLDDPTVWSADQTGKDYRQVAKLLGEAADSLENGSPVHRVHILAKQSSWIRAH